MRRQAEDGSTVEYPVRPDDIAEALAARTQFSTGLLPLDTLYVAQCGTQRLVVGYRPAQVTALLLEGTETSLRVPLPALVMLRLTTGGEQPRYAVYALGENIRPTSLEMPLCLPPLPNIYESGGGICWGSVHRASVTALTSSDLSEDWTLLLGSPFTAHSVGGKSRRERQDIRRQLITLDQRRARVYPRRDLLPARCTLGEAIQRLCPSWEREP